MKKKLITAMLIAGMVFGITACGEAEKEPTDNTSEVELTDASDDKSDTSAGSDSSSGRIVSVSDVSDYVKLGEYKGLSLERTLYTATDEDIEQEIEYELQETGEEVTDGTVEDGDMVTINFTGTIDGKEFDGGTAEDYELLIGNDEMIDGFEEGIIGMKKGETKELDLTFPEDYYEDSVAGKDVVFEITLQKFTRSAELNDKWVAANTDFKTVDEYRESIRQDLEDMYVDSADYMLYSDAWNQVSDSSEIIEYPQEDVDQAMEAYMTMYEEYAESADIEMEEFLESQGMTEEEYEDYCRECAEYKVAQNLIVQGIMDAEGLSLEDEGIEDLKAELVEEYGYDSIEELIETFGEQEVNESLALLLVEHYIVDNADVTEVIDDAANEDYDIDLLDEEMELDYDEESEDAVSEDDTVTEE